MRFSKIKFFKILTATLFLSSILMASSVFASGPAPCSDGTTDCGSVGSGGGTLSEISSSCTLVGRANQGGQICNTSMGTGTFPDPNNNPGSFFNFYVKQGVLPSSVPSTDPYNTAIQFYPNMSATLIFDPIDDEGSVSAGSMNASYMGCTCGPNDVTGTGCGASNPRTITNGTISPGNPINLTVINSCKPNDNIDSSHVAPYGGGSAEVEVTDGAVQCYTAAYYTWEVENGYMDPSNLGRAYAPDPTVPRCDYVGTPKTCSINNFSASYPSGNSISSGGTVPLSFSVAGTAGQNWSISPSITPSSSGTISGTTGSGGGTTAPLTSSTTYTLTYGLNGLTPCTASTTVVVGSTPPPTTPVINVTGGNTQTVTPGQTYTLPFNFSNIAPGTTTNVGNSDCKWTASSNLDPTKIFISACNPTTLSD